MRKLLVTALCVLPLMTTTVYAQGFTTSPRGSSAGDASGPGKSNANVDGASGAAVSEKLSKGVKDKKEGERSHHTAESQTKKQKHSRHKPQPESSGVNKETTTPTASTTQKQ